MTLVHTVTSTDVRYITVAQQRIIFSSIALSFSLSVSRALCYTVLHEGATFCELGFALYGSA